MVHAAAPGPAYHGGGSHPLELRPIGEPEAPVTKTALLLGALLWAAPALAEEERTEALLGVASDFDAGKVSFEVASTGCTGKKDFRVKRDGDTLTLLRLRRDACKAMPQRTKIDFTLEELGVTPHKPFKVANPFIVNENVALLK